MVSVVEANWLLNKIEQRVAINNVVGGNLCIAQSFEIVTDKKGLIGVGFNRQFC
jgi:hypothetical protein